MGSIGWTCAASRVCGWLPSPRHDDDAGDRVAYLAHRAADYGVHAGPVSVDMRAVRARKQGIIDADSRQILGCAILGLDGGEIMTIIQVAMMGALPYTAIADATLPHPTLADGLNTLFSSLDA